MQARIILATIAGVLAASLATDPGAAQSTGYNRTFVSGAGIDNSNCAAASRPCRTLAYAVARTVAGGAVVIQNAAEYGSVTIARAISIIGPDGGGATVTGGITVSTGSSDTVTLRGLEIVGGNTGINLNSFGSLFLTDSIVRGATYGIETFASGNVTIVNSTINDAGDTNIYLGGGDNLVITGSTVSGGVNLGLSVSGSSRVVDCTIVNSGTGLSFVGTAFVKGSLLAGNGIGLALASNTTVLLDTTTIVGNGIPVSAINAGGAANSYGNNNIIGNVQGPPIGMVSTN